MPIVFSCACGKALRVPDTAAGKKTRCPACGAIATAPAPEPAPEPEFEVVEAPPPAPRNPRRDIEDDSPPLKLADEEPPRRKKRKRRRGLGPSGRVESESAAYASGDPWFQSKQVMFIGLGALICVGGVAAIFADDRPIRFVRAICMFIVGVGLIIRGLTGNFDD